LLATQELGNILGQKVYVHDEVTLSDGSARPDFAVDTAGGRVGYIELKALEKGIPDKNWRPIKHDRDQFGKLSVLPNLIYTNGKYWVSIDEKCWLATLLSWKETLPEQVIDSRKRIG
jgi:hypothetical protein